jgi:hypothetical protein
VTGFAIYDIHNGRHLWGFADTKDLQKFASKLAYAAQLFGHIEVVSEHRLLDIASGEEEK